MAPSLPAVSVAWNTTSKAWRFEGVEQALLDPQGLDLILQQLAVRLLRFAERPDLRRPLIEIDGVSFADTEGLGFVFMWRPCSSMVPGKRATARGHARPSPRPQHVGWS